MKTKQIQWPEIIALLLLQLAILISWIAYHQFQPELLIKFGLNDFQLQLAIIQGIILLVIPPVAGHFTDQMREKGNTRVPVINTGIHLVAMVFMVVALTIWANPPGIIRSLFPIMIVAWLILMNVFHGPALSMIEMLVPANRLPQVMAIFTISADVTTSLEPSIVDVFEFFGAPLTFAAGGCLVFGAGWWLKRKLDLQALLEDEPRHFFNDTEQRSTFELVKALGIGLGLGLCTTFFFDLVPYIAERNLELVANGSLKGNHFASALIGLSALVAYPIGKWTQRRLTQENWLLLGYTISFFCILGIFFSNGLLFMALCVAFPIAFATMGVHALPVVFGSLSPSQKVLGVGVFFAGTELTGSLAGIFLAL